MSKGSLSSFLDKVMDALASEKLSNKTEGVGLITSYKDGVIEIEGLSGLKMGEVVSIKGTSSKALVQNLEKDRSYALVLRPDRNLKEGLFVESTGEILSVPVGEGIVGRVVDSLGSPIDGKGDFKVEANFPHERIAPGVITRKSVSEPVQTGIVAIDSLIPIGRGQRELIIGDRQTGKTTIAIDTILNQHDQNMVCIYVAVAQKESKVAQVVRTLEEKGAMKYSIVVSAGSSDSAAMQFLAPYAGIAIAEYFLSKGKDVLIVYDDLSKHAVAYREISLLLKRPPGREAYPGDVFYLHSRLLERACKLNEDFGGGSITALPIIETQAGDVSAYIPTNVISITDGQIFLASELYNKGVLPAIDVGISVSRVGGSAQTNVMKKVSGSIKLELAQFRELESFLQFSSDLDDTTKKVLKRGKRIVEALKQKAGSPYSLWQEVLVIFASTGGFMDIYPSSMVQEKITSLFNYATSKHKKLIEMIEKDKKMTDEVKEGLGKLMKEFNTLNASDESNEDL